jgi:hypothetical protein
MITIGNGTADFRVGIRGLGARYTSGIMNDAGVSESFLFLATESSRAARLLVSRDT